MPKFIKFLLKIVLERILYENGHLAKKFYKSFFRRFSITTRINSTDTALKVVIKNNNY